MTPAPDAIVTILRENLLFGYYLVSIDRKDSSGLEHTTEEWITQEEYREWEENHKKWKENQNHK